MCVEGGGGCLWIIHFLYVLGKKSCKAPLKKYSPRLHARGDFTLISFFFFFLKYCLFVNIFRDIMLWSSDVADFWKECNMIKMIIRLVLYSFLEKLCPSAILQTSTSTGGCLHFFLSGTSFCRHSFPRKYVLFMFFISLVRLGTGGLAFMSVFATSRSQS